MCNGSRLSQERSYKPIDGTQASDWMILGSYFWVYVWRQSENTNNITTFGRGSSLREIIKAPWIIWFDSTANSFVQRHTESLEVTASILNKETQAWKRKPYLVHVHSLRILSARITRNLSIRTSMVWFWMRCTCESWTWFFSGTEAVYENNSAFGICRLARSRAVWISSRRSSWKRSAVCMELILLPYSGGGVSQYRL